jgi:hypothetical protein
MKKTILILVALSTLVLVSCDPFGSEKTMAYITGTIYSDAAMTIPAEGVGVELVVSPDSAAFLSQTVFTNTSGVFFMEIQFFPSLPEEGGTGYTLPSSGTAGLTAHYGTASYTYRSVDDGFVISAGDTLEVWPVDITSFTGAK